MNLNLNIRKRLQQFYTDSKHVMSVSYKPDINTFKRTIKIVLIGTLILGIMGFVLSVIITFITSGL